MNVMRLVLISIALSNVAFACALPVPEVSPASGVGALALLSGALLVMRGRRKK